MKNKSATLLKVFVIAMISAFVFYQGCSKHEVAENVKLAAFQLYVSGLVVAADMSQSDKDDVNCFEKSGLNYEIIKRSKGPEVVDALVGGSADFGTLANTPVVLQAMQKSKLVIFATIQTTDHDIKVVAHKSSSIVSGESLKGKKIGFVGGTIGEIFLNRYLDEYGIKKDDVNLTSAGPAQLRDLFLNNSLDAIIIWEPIIQDILSDPAVNKNDVYVDVDSSLYVLRMHLVAKPETLKSKRKEATKLVEALICGENYLSKEPILVREALEKWLDRKHGTLEKVFDPSTFNVELNVPVLIKELEEEAQWAKESVFSNNVEIPSDLSECVDQSILKSVDASRVIE